MDERIRFVIRLKDGESMAALCRDRGAPVKHFCCQSNSIGCDLYVYARCKIGRGKKRRSIEHLAAGRKYLLACGRKED